MTRAASLLLALSVFAAPSTALARLKVVTTTTDLGWFAKELGKDRVEVTTLTKGYQDPHYMEPKPSYIVQLSKADALFHVGLELEVGWLPKLLDGAHNPDIQSAQPGLFTPASALALLEKPQGSIDRSQGDIHPFGNPHYWLSPPNAAAIARAMAERLGQLDREGAPVYRDRAEALAREIERKDAEWKARLEKARGLKVITYHRTYSYFLDHFALVAVDYIEPKPGVPPSSRHLAHLIERVKVEKVALLLVENFFEPRNAEFVSQRAGVPMVIAPVSVEGDPKATTWFDLMELLVAAIEKAAQER